MGGGLSSLPLTTGASRLRRPSQWVRPATSQDIDTLFVIEKKCCGAAQSCSTTFSSEL
jgi:hypothetical protein